MASSSVQASAGTMLAIDTQTGDSAHEKLTPALIDHQLGRRSCFRRFLTLPPAETRFLQKPGPRAAPVSGSSPAGTAPWVEVCFFPLAAVLQLLNVQRVLGSDAALAGTKVVI